MKLYYAPGTCALACWIALEWTGATYEVEKVDPRSEAYRKINPLGTVPAIDIGLDRPVAQADAILQYIAEQNPSARLGAGEDVADRLKFNETMCFLTGDFHPAFWPFFTPERFTTDQDEASLKAVKTATETRVDRVLSHLDSLIGPEGHVHVARRTIADAYAFAMTRWSENYAKSWRDYPRVAVFMEAMNADPAVRLVLERSAA